MDDEIQTDLQETAFNGVQAVSRQNLIDFLPMLDLAIHGAGIQYPGSTALLMVAVKNPDGSGKTVCDFAARGFVDDILHVLGYATMDELVLDADAKEVL